MEKILKEKRIAERLREKQKKKKTWKHSRRKRIGNRLRGAEEKEGK